MTEARTLVDKIWSDHVVETVEDYDLLYVDRHIIHEGSRTPFEILRKQGLSVARPDLTLGTADHYAPTHEPRIDASPHPDMRLMLERFVENTDRFGIEAFNVGARNHGIVHVVGPEVGFTLPGVLLVCGDSHTSSHGALGALAFGIGASEVAHVLGTQTIWQKRPKTMRLHCAGNLTPSVEPKDLILSFIATHGTHVGTGHIIEYAGPAIEAMSVEGRLTICNMSIEAGARAGLVAPDEQTFSYIEGRRYAPRDGTWDEALANWKRLRSDANARFDREVSMDAGSVAPMVSWGVSPQMSAPITDTVPAKGDDMPYGSDKALDAALSYMGLEAGTRLLDIAIDLVFIGSCTNSRIEDLRRAASVLKGHRVAVPTIVSPGSNRVRAQAEEEGLDRIFREAGAEWHFSGCSLCVGMNGHTVGPGQRCLSTANRNFKGRQGKNSRTHLASPSTAAASAIAGRIADPRQLVGS